jgi:hypothetical protein
MLPIRCPSTGSQNGRREFLAVLTSDISLDWLRNIWTRQDMRNGLRIYHLFKGYAGIHPNPKLIMKETIFSIATRRNLVLRAVGERMVQGGSSFAEVEYGMCSPAS